jgi:hypothetical protein
MASRDLTNSNRQYRRILRNFGGSDTIQGLEDAPIDPDKEDAKFIGLTVLIGGAILAVTPQDMIALGWVAAGIVVAFAGVAMFVCPGERAPIEWMSAIGRFKRAPKRLTNHSEDPKERTQTLTQVERILPMSGAAERRDGALVGLVEVKGQDMALAEESTWNAAAEGFEKMARAVDSTVEIYSPSRTVDPARLTEGYLNRGKDEDVKRNETLQHLIGVYRRVLPDEMNERGTAVRRFFVVISVTPKEVRRADRGALGKLVELPGLGGPIERFGLAKRGPSDEEIKARQKSILEARKRAVENAISSTEGCTTNPVDSEYFAALIREFWTGIRTKYQDKPVPNKQTPVVHHNRTEDDENPEQTGGY